MREGLNDSNMNKDSGDSLLLVVEPAIQLGEGYDCGCLQTIHS